MTEQTGPIRPPASLETTIPNGAEIGAWVLDYCAREASPVTGQSHPAIQLLDNYMVEFAAHPGKRLRGRLVGIGHEMFGGSHPQAALHVAGIVELAQMYLLIEDDVMDRSDTRRGIDTLHVRVRNWLQDRGVDSEQDIQHISDYVAVTGGLRLSHKIQRLINNTPEVTDATRLRLSEIYNNSMIKTGGGQVEDLVFSTYDKNTASAILNMYGCKTSYYSIIAPLQMGAAIAGASVADMLALSRFGWHAGRGYQLRDDWLGMFGDPERTGKPLYGDLDEKKMTLLFYGMFHKASIQDQQFLSGIRHDGSNEPLSPEQLEARNERVQAIVEKTGAKAYIEQKAALEIGLAQAVLDKHPEWSQHNVRQLRELLRYMLLRES